jgi:hypothetical protein
MAKQTFTTGQVLTAAQMQSLQNTALGGGPATAKTANYVLVAADAGTTVAMDAATATTITVDTGLFAAGDTVFIQNIGAGDCTITAGTATVDTAGSLILPQYDAGILYFTSASAAIFYDYIQVGATSPLTTKGDLYTYSTSDTRLGVGADGTTLVADSSTATGLVWQAASSGALTLISRTTFTNAATTNVDSLFSSTYTNYQCVINFKPATDGTVFRLRGRYGSTTHNGNAAYGWVGRRWDGVTSSAEGAGVSHFSTIGCSDSFYQQLILTITKPSSSDNLYMNGIFQGNNIAGSGQGAVLVGGGRIASDQDWTGLELTQSSGNLTGTIAVYGLANS